MTVSQPSLFDEARHDEARVRAAAWARCERAAAVLDAAVGPVERAVAVELLATCRIGYDLADGLAVDDLDPTGLSFAGAGRGTPAHEAYEADLRPTKRGRG